MKKPKCGLCGGLMPVLAKDVRVCGHCDYPCLTRPCAVCRNIPKAEPT